MAQTEISIVIYSPLLHYNFFVFLFHLKSMILHACWTLPFPALNWFTFGRNNAALKTEQENRKLNSSQMNCGKRIIAYSRKIKKYEENKLN